MYLITDIIIQKGSANDMKTVKQHGWVFYIGNDNELDSEKVGKWMYFFNDRKFAERICTEAVEQGIVVESKHSDNNEGVACFYLNCDDLEGHKKVISYFLVNDLIRRTKAGKLYNISFKRDEQTSLLEYGNGFKSEIKLTKFIDLTTQKWIITEDEFESMMPPEVQREMRWMKAFNRAKALEATKIEDITYEQCKEAVKTWCLSLQFVPEQYRTEEICRSAMSQRSLSARVVEYIPKKILSTTFVDDVIRENTYLIGSFPAKLLTRETIIELTLKDSTLIKKIPNSLKDLSFYETIVQKNGMYLRFVPHELITRQICEGAVRSKPMAIKYVPGNIIDATICKLAVSIDWKAIRSIPAYHLTDELFEIALTFHPKSENAILKAKEKVTK